MVSHADSGPRWEPKDGYLLRNEFARVIVRVDDGANGPRLQVTALGADAEIFLDPLELAGLAMSRHEDLAAFVFPSRLNHEAEDGDSSDPAVP